jgi:predicted nicotinamide N-methyase
MSTYQIRRHTVSIQSHRYTLRTLLDRQQFSDDDAMAADLGISSATWSLFGVVWPASRILAAHVSKMDLRGMKVLEIGCGIGLSSIVLHRLGVDITASDYHPLAEEFLRLNVKANKLQPLKFLTGNWDTHNPLLGEFDLIIGSDILYEPAHPGLVSGFIHRHSEKQSAVIIADPNRGNRGRFTRHMQSMGYSHRYERFDDNSGNSNPCKGRILHYHRNTTLQD